MLSFFPSVSISIRMPDVVIQDQCKDRNQDDKDKQGDKDRTTTHPT